MMNLSPSLVYKEYYGTKEQYDRTHGILHKLKDESQGFPYSRQFYPEYKLFDYDSQNTVSTSTLTDEEYNEIQEALNSIDLYSVNANMDSAIEFEKKYGFYPHMWIDDSDYKKSYTKFVTDNVDFKEGILDINVKWTDGTVSKAPNCK